MAINYSKKKLGFGKYRSQTWGWVKSQDPNYLSWLAGSDFGQSNAKIQAALKSLFEVNLHLKEDQQAAVDAFEEACLVGGERCFRLVGGAGYGKSYAVTAIADLARKAGYTVSGMAVSYVATQVMAESLDLLGIESSTVARALGLKPNKDSYKESYGPSDRTEGLAFHLVAYNRMLIVDEYSMTDDVTADIIYRAMEHSNSILLVVGDSAQLPSPSQRFMSAFDTIPPMAQLTIPKRFAPGSVLHDVELGVRNDPWAMATVLRDKTDGVSVIQHGSRESLVNQQIADLERYPDDTGLMLFYRRAKVAEANRFIRQTVYGEVADVVPGERLRVMRTTFIPVVWDSEKGRWESARYYSGTFINVKDVEMDEVTVEFQDPDLPDNDLVDLTVDCFRVKTPGGAAFPVVFSNAEHSADPLMAGGESFNTALNKVKQYCIERQELTPAIWKLYHRFRDHFLQVSYAYATTVHRSQGASVDRIYLSPEDVLQGGDYIARRLAYVAATRAKVQIHYV